MSIQRRLVVPPIGLWTGDLDFVPAGRVSELAAEIESLGYGILWVPELAGRDVFVQLAMVLASTDRLMGATGIANIWGRDPVAMTGGVKALTEAYPERVLLGVGVSHQNLVETLRGHEWKKPLGAMTDYLNAMDASPYTSERPSTPVRRVVGALGPRMLELAGMMADGAHTYLVSPEHSASARKTFGAAPLLCPAQMYLLESDPAAARQTARSALAVYLGQPHYQQSWLRMGLSESDLEDGGSDYLVDSMVAWGSEEDVIRRVQAHLDAGADHVCLHAISNTRRTVQVEQWRRMSIALRDAGHPRSGQTTTPQVLEP
jgi:probable F420-dependent oxidoreductase